MKKAPKGKDYIGNPMGYYADKAAYGKEMMRKAQMGTATDSNIEPLEFIQEVGKDRRQNKIDKLNQRNEMAKIKAQIAANKADKARSNAEKRAARHSERVYRKGQYGFETGNAADGKITPKSKVTRGQYSFEKRNAANGKLTSKSKSKARSKARSKKKV